MKGAMPREVQVFAPATVSNLGPGFDVLGLALEGPGDTVVASLGGRPGVHIVQVTGDQGRLPLDAAANTAGIAARATLAKAGMDGAGIELELTKGMPIGSGMGSSAASAAAAATAVNLLVGSPLRKQELIEPCLEAEAAVSGRHADNVAPALLGGLILVRSVDPVDVLRLPVPEGILVVVVTPNIDVPTKRAREVLPDRVALSDMVETAANLGAFVSACYSRDLGLWGRCVVDRVVTPVRARLVPGSREAMRAASGAGALASSISGAGPSVFAFCHSRRGAASVAQAMVSAFAEAGLEAATVVSPASCPGARRL